MPKPDLCLLNADACAIVSPINDNWIKAQAKSSFGFRLFEMKIGSEVFVVFCDASIKLLIRRDNFNYSEA